MNPELTASRVVVTPISMTNCRSIIAPTTIAGWILAALLTSITSSLAAAAPEPAPDQSLTADAYTAAGLPAIDKPWLPSDFHKARRALDKIARTDPAQLPRFKSATSGKLFDRLTSDSNIENLKVKYSKPKAQLREIGEVLQSLGGVFSVYVKAMKPEATYDSETLELGIYIVKAEHVAAICADDPAEAKSSAQGVAKIKSGLALTLGGVIETMSDDRMVRRSESLRVAGELKTIVAEVYPVLLPEGQSSVREKLQKALESEKDPANKAALHAIVDELPK